jgi:hypothetical protein
MFDDKQLLISEGTVFGDEPIKNIDGRKKCGRRRYGPGIERLCDPLGFKLELRAD